MAKFSYQTDVHIHAPIEKVYRYLADFPRHVEWNHQPQSMTALTGGDPVVGSQYRTEESSPSNMPFLRKIIMSMMAPLGRVLFKMDGYTIAEITDLTSNKRVAWTAHMPDREGKKLMQMHWELLLDERDGGVLVTQTCQIDPPADSPMFKMVTEDWVVNGKSEVALNLKRLKAILEA
jgi:hypothetical protein